METRDLIYQRTTVRELENDLINLKPTWIKHTPLMDEYDEVCQKLICLVVKKIPSIAMVVSVGSESAKTVLIENTKHFKLSVQFNHSGNYDISLVTRVVDEIRNSKSNFKQEFCKPLGFVYFIKSQFGWKIGKSKDIPRRHKVFEVKLPFDFDFIYYIRTINHSMVEKSLHAMLNPSNINGEWFDINDDGWVKVMNYCQENGLKLKRTRNYTNKPFLNKGDYTPEMYEKVKAFYDWVFSYPAKNGGLS